MQNVEDVIQVRAYKMNNKNASHFSQFTSVKVKKISTKSRAFREKLIKLRLRQYDSFLIK